jgi:predicted PurR-regulated permease PerM
MTNLFLGIITLACVVSVIVGIYVLLALREAIKKLTEFIGSTETSLKPTLEELPKTLGSIRRVTENVEAVTDDARTLSGSVREIGENISLATGYVEEITSLSVAQAAGVRAGIRAGLNVLLNSLLARRKKQMERR